MPPRLHLPMPLVHRPTTTERDPQMNPIMLHIYDAWTCGAASAILRALHLLTY